MRPEALSRLIASRRCLTPPPGGRRGKAEAEGGCGVVGLACSAPVRGRHILAPCRQMHNRGNGKGGGLAAAGLVPEQLGVDERTLREDYLIQVALLEPSAYDDVVRQFVEPALDVRAGGPAPTLDDHREVEGLEVRPPDVWRCFARVREDVLDAFIAAHGLEDVDRRTAEDEYISQWAFRLNRSLYAADRRRAFVLSYGRDLLVFKIVGYAEQALRYYRLEDLQARVWIGHQRYPTKGRVWHPGGAHPFAALDVALVHNGDFANYHAVSEYLAQRHLYPLFLTDTEVAVLLFDLWARTYGYPLEHVIEALAPTTERDFLMLPPDRQRIYRALQATHIHGSPDGPWFFIIARTVAGGRDRGTAAARAAQAWQLIGITDTSMLRPQVFALQEGAGVSVGVVASEKQAIDATLASLHHEDPRVGPVADLYWNARGGSYTDGGAFVFTVTPDGMLVCTNKFGQPVSVPPGQEPYVPLIRLRPPALTARPIGGAAGVPSPDFGSEEALRGQARRGLAEWDYEALVGWLRAVRHRARRDPRAREMAVGVLTWLIDRRLPAGRKKRSSVLALLHGALYGVLREVPPLPADGPWHRLAWAGRPELVPPPAPDHTLVVDAEGFPSEGPDSLARTLVAAYEAGWRRYVVFSVRGQRFVGVGFGPRTAGVRIDVYGSPGDYLGSGLDGMEIRVHGDAQDQVGQILKAGRLVIHGSVGQTLLYGAKGGEVYILGNAAGRPLINAVGRPRVVINGTALDYLAESFMAGDPLHGGGFCILNGIRVEPDGTIADLDTPYPGGNLFSLASGGAIYVRDPHRRLDDEQLNGGRYAALTDADWAVILPYLEENERLFDIPVERLLTVDGVRRHPRDVYRKVEPVELAVLK
ncbi:MAG: glutamate synthase [Armatimonadota bacterium]|nr:glutamate synthase [Armatimonadota bacterium]MDR7401697.1 glutamate synthase [Armatimonadota bacterium]MDR7403759.1 glutamate synthase [Armatimonadota bacterium]MDR7471327.1 glutamate synthase [Armatimonadota bacterium]MDR7506461.1 glutamate synthase [Armatimonadota bacterium]